MTQAEFLNRLRELDVAVWVETGRLRVNAPAGALTDELREELARRKEALIAYLAAGGSDLDNRMPLEPAPRSGPLPLSCAQQRLWFLEQLEPGNTAYTFAFGLRFAGELNVTTLEAALNELRRRHEILRTTFPGGQEEPVQHVAPPAPVPLPIESLEAVPEGERLSEAHRRAAAKAHQPFDLAQGPLLRPSLLRLAGDDHVLLLVIHHIIFDGWSAGIFVQELAAIYNAFLSGQASPLMELAIQYGDFACWQHQWLQGERVRRQLDYWRRQLGGNPPMLELPTDRPRPASASFRGACHPFLIPAPLADRLRELAQREGATLFMILLAGFKALMHISTGQRDLIIGTAIANRNQAKIEGLIGLFLNTLALRTSLEGGPTFRELLGRVREVTLEAYANQDVPFERLVEELHPERHLSHMPLVQVMFLLQNVPLPPVSFTGLTLSPFTVDADAIKCDLNIHMGESAEGIWAHWFYNTDLFDAATMERMGNHYRVILEGALADPDRPIGRLPVLTPEERAQGAAPVRRIAPVQPFIEFPVSEIEQSVAARFEKIAAEHHSRLAVRTRLHAWNYGELNHRANQVAHALLGLTGQNGRWNPPAAGETRVGLLFEHDAPMVAAVLGSLKAGHTYVPLDPTWPLDRLHSMLEDASPQALLTNHHNRALAAELAGPQLPVLDLERLAVEAGGDNPVLAVPPEALAYILYTSGSTGQPKGIMQRHRAINHFARVYVNNLHLGPGDGLTLLSSYSFDAAVMDIFGALLSGATLHPLNLKAEGLEGLAESLASQPITVYHSTPTVFRHFCATLDPRARLERLRLVVLGGEAVFSRDLALFKQHFGPGCLFVNGLGPTESTIALQHFMDHHTELTRNAVPVGFPVDETEVRLLDEHGQPAELYGEIAIRSPHVALGYWRRPELTERVFLPDPEGGGRRVYRTGDMGRRLADGSLEFVGRGDAQVKIRGYRIETGEVEARLLEHPHVTAAAVVVRGARDGDQGSLVAFFVSSQPEPPTAGELRRFLARKLPDYMVPAQFFPLQALPLTLTGKVDRQALPDPAGSLALRREVVPPRNEIERTIARHWAEVLGLEQVGIFDNFFELGGHSLTAMRLIARLRMAFGIDLSLRSVFQDSTVAGLASDIVYDERMKRYHCQTGPSPWSSLVAMQPQGTRRPFFLVSGAHADEDQFLRYLSNLIPHLGLDQPVYGFRPRGLDGQGDVHESVEEMAADYIAELRAFQPESPYLIGGECIGGVVAYEMAQQLVRQGAEVGLLLLMDTACPDLRGNIRFYLRRARRKLSNGMEHLRRLLQPDIVSAWRHLTEYLGRKRQLLLPRSDDERRLCHIRRVEEIYPRLILHYRPQAYPGKLTILVNREQHMSNPAIGWDGMARQGVEVHMVPGNHITRLTMYGRETAERLKSCLERAQCEDPSRKIIRSLA